jgi:hypothetical protein
MILKVSVVICLGLLAVVMGSMSAAWRRACVHITRKTFGVVTKELVTGMTPGFVASRHGWSLLLLLGSSILAFLFFSWKVALGTFFATYTLVETIGFIFPRPSSMYYVRVLVSDCRVMIAMHTRFGETDKATDLQGRLDVVLAAYGADAERNLSTNLRHRVD